MRDEIDQEIAAILTHEEFVERARATSTNASGLRLLAHHVRLLYTDIRALLADGNGYKYIAGVLADVRGESAANPLDMAVVIRVYHHRDRIRRGDSAKSKRAAAELSQGEELASAFDSPVASSANPSPASEVLTDLGPDTPVGFDIRPAVDLEPADRSRAPLKPEPGPPQRAIPASTNPENPQLALTDLASVNRAIHQRANRKRLIAPGSA